MKAQTLKQIYSIILHDDSVSLGQFEDIVGQLKNYNGHTDQPTKSKRGRPLGSKSKKTLEREKLEKTFSRPNEPGGK